jgi:hypothetical protein
MSPKEIQKILTCDFQLHTLNPSQILLQIYVGIPQEFDSGYQRAADETWNERRQAASFVS